MVRLRHVEFVRIAGALGLIRDAGTTDRIVVFVKPAVGRDCVANLS
jgi:hypothetical protein